MPPKLPPFLKENFQVHKYVYCNKSMQMYFEENNKKYNKYKINDFKSESELTRNELAKLLIMFDPKVKWTGNSDIMVNTINF